MKTKRNKIKIRTKRERNKQKNEKNAITTKRK